MKKYLFAFIATFICISPFITISIKAQRNPGTFSGSSPRSYQCINIEGGGTTPLLKVYGNYLKRPNIIGSTVADKSNSPITIETSDDFYNNYDEMLPSIQEKITGILPKASNGTFLCDSANINILRLEERLYYPQATLVPPTFQIIEAWFVQLVFMAYAFVGLFSFIFLVVLGYRYQISMGDVTKLTEIRGKILYYFLGLILTFMAYPLTNGLFQFLGVNSRVECYNFPVPSFRFFFDDLCVDYTGNLVASESCKDLAKPIVESYNEANNAGPAFFRDRDKDIKRINLDSYSRNVNNNYTQYACVPEDNGKVVSCDTEKLNEAYSLDGYTFIGGFCFRCDTESLTWEVEDKADCRDGCSPGMVRCDLPKGGFTCILGDSENCNDYLEKSNQLHNLVQ